jgi:hypothetical protein
MLNQHAKDCCCKCEKAICQGDGVLFVSCTGLETNSATVTVSGSVGGSGESGTYLYTIGSSGDGPYFLVRAARI